ncbi:hypothetical protein AB1L30_04960 [Bremerella sp. JC817]|uniref:hypothetical protein n=1 Tax=Bremerella sp. JC817 TaxID=3231756 RepID=UPI003457D50B
MNDIHLNVHGLGVFLYSPFAAETIAPHSNFLEQRFLTPEQVLPFVYEGTLVAFQTGEGFFRLRFRQGYPAYPEEYLTYMLRLAVLVKGGKLCFRDLSDLYDWNPHCSQEQQLSLDDGYYHLSVCSNRDLTQDEIDILIYLNPLEEMPALDFRGNVPVLFG